MNAAPEGIDDGYGSDASASSGYATPTDQKTSANYQEAANLRAQRARGARCSGFSIPFFSVRECSVRECRVNLYPHPTIKAPDSATAVCRTSTRSGIPMPRLDQAYTRSIHYNFPRPMSCEERKDYEPEAL